MDTPVMDASQPTTANPPPQIAPIENASANPPQITPIQNAPAVPSVRQPVADSQPSTPPITATSPNKHLHGIITRVLGALAGTPEPSYTVDPDSGKMTAIPSAPFTTRQKIERIANNALVGLSAGASVPEQKSGLASGLAGAGAGARAVAEKQLADIKASREDARKDAEEQAQAKLRQMEIAKANALNFTLHMNNLKQQNDLDPVRAQNKEIADAFKAMPDHGVREMSADAAEKAVRDPNNQVWAHTHLILPAGINDVTDADGNPVKDARGNFRTEGRVYVIDGMKDGKVPIPASIAADVQKFRNYGDLAKVPGLDHIKEGDEYDPSQFVRLYNGLLSAKVEVEKGWAPGQVEISEDKDGNVIQRNPVNNDSKPATPAQTQKFQTDKANLAEKQQQTKTSKATEEKERLDTQLKRQQLATGPTSNLTGEDYLKTLPQARASSVRAVGEGRQLLPANRKEALALLDDVHQAYTDYDEGLGKTWQKTRNEYMGSGKTATQIVPAYNTALEHMQALYDNTTLEGIANPLSKAYQRREVELGYVAREVGKAVSAGALTQKESEDLLNTLKGGLTPALKRERITETAKLLHDKIEEYQTKFNAAAPSSAVQVPILLSKKAAASLDYVTNGGGQASSQSGQNQNATPATHVISLATALKNHPGATEDQIRAWAKANNYEVTN